MAKFINDAVLSTERGGFETAQIRDLVLNFYAGTTDVAVDLGGDVATVEPFTRALETGDTAGDLAVGLSAADPDGTTITEKKVALARGAVYRCL
jgi:hypothetical protein